MVEEMVLAVAEIKQNPSMLQLYKQISEREGRERAEAVFEERGWSYYNNQDVFYLSIENQEIYITLDSDPMDDNILMVRLFNLEFEQIGGRIRLIVPENASIFCNPGTQIRMELKTSGVSKILCELAGTTTHRF